LSIDRRALKDSPPNPDLTQILNRMETAHNTLPYNESTGSSFLLDPHLLRVGDDFTKLPVKCHSRK